MKTIFITGASSGIGKETAKYFSQQGWRVIATMRNPEKGEDLKDLPNMVIMPLDVSDAKQIKEISKKALAEYDVDVLFNNAGYGVMAPLERMPEDAIHKVFTTDVLGTMLVTQQFIPHFKNRKAGTIMATTSLAAIIGLPRDSVYGAAKRAQQGMLESLYYEMKPFNVFVKAMIPGGTKTNFQTPINDRTGYEDVAAHQQEYLLNGNSEFPGPEEAARVIYGAATDEKDQINYPTDSVCQALYDQYQSMGLEEFKKFFTQILYPEKAV